MKPRQSNTDFISSRPTSLATSTASSPASSLASAMYGLLAVFACWQLLHVMAASEAIPSPVATLVNLSRLLTTENLLMHLLYSLLRLGVALSLSLLVGAGLGVAIGMNKRLDQMISPILYVLFPLPKAALLPILFLFFGLGELTKVLLLFLIIVFQISVMTRDTVKSIPENIFLSARSMGLGQGALYRHVVLPCISKAVFSSLRIGVGTGIAVLFFVENYATSYGIGFFIMNSWSLINYLDMYSGILAMSLMGSLLFVALDYFERKYCGWTN